MISAVSCQVRFLHLKPVPVMSTQLLTGCPDVGRLAKVLMVWCIGRGMCTGSYCPCCLAMEWLGDELLAVGALTCSMLLVLLALALQCEEFAISL